MAKQKKLLKLMKLIKRKSFGSNVKNNDKIKKNILDKKIIREVYVPGKIVNLVV